jgi:ligand-binding sensor protein
MDLSDLLPVEEWIALEKRICDKFGVDANVFNIDGIRVTDHKAWRNELCPAIKATDKGQSFICAVAHMNLAIIAQNTQKPVAEECDAGLLKMVVPIFVGEDFIGTLCACGVLPVDGEADAFLINKITEIETEKIEQLSANIPTITPDQTEAFVAFAQKRISEILDTYAKR